MFIRGHSPTRWTVPSQLVQAQPCEYLRNYAANTALSTLLWSLSPQPLQWQGPFSAAVHTSTWADASKEAQKGWEALQMHLTVSLQ